MKSLYSPDQHLYRWNINYRFIFRSGGGWRTLYRLSYWSVSANNKLRAKSDVNEISRYSIRNHVILQARGRERFNYSCDVLLHDLFKTKTAACKLHVTQPNNSLVFSVYFPCYSVMSCCLIRMAVDNFDQI